MSSEDRSKVTLRDVKPYISVITSGVRLPPEPLLPRSPTMDRIKELTAVKDTSTQPQTHSTTLPLSTLNMTDFSLIDEYCGTSLEVHRKNRKFVFVCAECRFNGVCDECKDGHPKMIRRGDWIKGNGVVTHWGYNVPFERTNQEINIIRYI